MFDYHLENLQSYKMKSVDNSCNLFAGYYLYIEASKPRVNGDKATILTPYLNGRQCMKFSYHMYGRDIGSLNIYANNQKVFSNSGNEGNYWVNVEKPIIQSGRYRVSHDAAVKTRKQKFIAHSMLTIWQLHAPRAVLRTLMCRRGVFIYSCSA